MEKERDGLKDRLQHVTEQLEDARQQLAQAAAVASLGGCAGGMSGGVAAPAEAAREEGMQGVGDDPAAATPQLPLLQQPQQQQQQQQLQQRIAELLGQVEQLEFERAELRVKLEESETQVCPGCKRPATAEACYAALLSLGHPEYTVSFKSSVRQLLSNLSGLFSHPAFTSFAKLACAYGIQ
jgi:hypothetical protein